MMDMGIIETFNRLRKAQIGMSEAAVNIAKELAINPESCPFELAFWTGAAQMHAKHADDYRLGMAAGLGALDHIREEGREVPADTDERAAVMLRDLIREDLADDIKRDEPEVTVLRMADITGLNADELAEKLKGFLDDIVGQLADEEATD